MHACMHAFFFLPFFFFLDPHAKSNILFLFHVLFKSPHHSKLDLKSQPHVRLDNTDTTQWPQWRWCYIRLGVHQRIACHLRAPWCRARPGQLDPIYRGSAAQFCFPKTHPPENIANSSVGSAFLHTQSLVSPNCLRETPGMRNTAIEQMNWIDIWSSVEEESWWYTQSSTCVTECYEQGENFPNLCNPKSGCLVPFSFLFPFSLFLLKEPCWLSFLDQNASHHLKNDDKTKSQSVVCVPWIDWHRGPVLLVFCPRARKERWPPSTSTSITTSTSTSTSDIYIYHVHPYRHC